VKVGDPLTLPTQNRPAKPVDLTGHKRVPDQCQPDWVVKKYFGPDVTIRTNSTTPSL